ncbi:uncharacterized protein LOC108602073 [Drosophila busckii]|nr:uncharacterized protein LOC108602073 [Drosophila busckii]
MSEQSATNGHVDTKASNLPPWLPRITMENAVRSQIGDFEKIVAVTSHCSSAGDNYSTSMVRLQVEVEQLDHIKKSVSFVLKAQHCNEMMAAILSKLELFHKEEQMYHCILPKFEQLYSDVGKPIQFAPKAYKIDRDLGVDYILLEDLLTKGFKNSNRLMGLDFDHLQQVLQKLAAFHAASACYVEHYGMFSEHFTVGVFSESNRQLLQEFNACGAFLTQLKKWKSVQKIYEKLAKSDDVLVDRLLQDQQVSMKEFNVLNHGDCWNSNLMFLYDAFGKIKETLFVDFQVGKYGSPANDLYYLILSSAAPDIRIAKFDYLVRYYFDHLIENLKLLQYHRPLPKLRSLHASLFRNGLAAFMVVSKVLPVVMLDKPENGANAELYQNDDAKIKAAMYTNPKYVQAMTEILPWMDNRGLLDWQ